MPDAAGVVLRAVLVLAGGGSSRMGRDKATLPFAGEPLLARVLRRVTLPGVPQFVALGPRQQVDMPAGVRVFRDADERGGPLSALAASLAAVPDGLVAVVAGDLPFASAAVLQRLAALAAAYGCEAAVPVVTGHAQVLHAVYRASLAPAFSEAVAAGQHSLRRVVAERRTLWVPRQALADLDPQCRFAIAVNTPEELATSERMAA